MWEIPANIVFPFRPFIGEIGQDTKGNETYRVERLPADQIEDLRRIAQFFVEFPEMAKLDEPEAAQVADVLANPRSCSKYSIELGNSCTSCWLGYLHSDAVKTAIDALPANELKRAANASLPILIAALTEALGDARRRVDEAVREIDDPTKGKKQFYDVDYLNIYHTHSERPQYKTSTSHTDSAQAIADAIRAVAQPAPVQSGVSVEQFEQLMAMAVEMKAKLDEYEKGGPDVENKAAKIKEKIKEAKDE